MLLAELFSNEGVGTMVHMDEYGHVRKATSGDVPEIVSLIRTAVEDEELVPRNRSEIAAQIDDYYLLEIDGNAVGTVAVHYYPGDKVAELACLFVKRDHDGEGYGRHLVGFAEKKARELGAEKMIALSTQASDYFERIHGFQRVGDEILPQERADKREESGRNSFVLAKEVRREPTRELSSPAR